MQHQSIQRTQKRTRIASTQDQVATPRRGSAENRPPPSGSGPSDPKALGEEEWIQQEEQS
jgi:hypothetical protein